MSESTSKELLDLRKKNELLEEKLKKARVERPEGTEDLAQGDDIFDIDFVFEAKTPSIGKNQKRYWKKGEVIDGKVSLSWNQIFGFLGQT